MEGDNQRYFDGKIETDFVRNVKLNDLQLLENEEQENNQY